MDMGEEVEKEEKKKVGGSGKVDQVNCSDSWLPCGGHMEG